jgi:hypothetical protein
MRKIAFAVLSLCLFSCGNEEKKQGVEVGKYLYIDKDSTLHITRKCTKFIIDDSKDFGVKRISSENIPPEYLDKCCSYCVNDEAYELLVGMSKESLEQQHKLHPYD